MAIKHLSFDLWGTIFKSNPSYSAARAEIIQTVYEDHVLDINQIDLAFKQVSWQVNTFQKRYAREVPYEFKHMLVLDRLKIGPDACDNAYLSLFDKLVLEHPPILIYPKCVDLINNFRAGASDALSIVSNTQFVKGKVLLQVLKNYGVDTSRINCFFSDEIGMCKPDPLIYFNVVMLNKHAAKETLHIGDDPITDLVPARKAGMEAFQITNAQSWCELRDKLEDYAKDSNS